MAVDGSFIQLLSDPALLKHFGGLGPAQTAATALGSLLYDIIEDAKIAPVSANERSLAKEHMEILTGLESYQAGRESVIFDRGYPSQAFIEGTSKNLK